MNKICIIIWGCIAMLCSFTACKKTPQQVKRVGVKTEIDSVMLAQLEFNQRMASSAERICTDYVENEVLNYVLDDFGFWYYKNVRTGTDTIQPGQEVMLQLQVYELNDSLLTDVKMTHIVGSGDLPLAINRSLKMMSLGEQMLLVCPWYTAYGVEGTSLVKPYSNLKIVVNVEN